MLVLGLVLGYTAAAIAASPLLTGRAWSAAAPRLALLWCQMILAVIVSSVLLVAAMAAVSVQHLHADVGHLLHACAVAVWQGVARPDVAVTTTAGLLAVLVLGQLARVATSSVLAALHVRRRQREALALLDSGPRGDRVTYVDSHEAFAYCVPGAGGRIVISTAAASELDPEELRAVVAHERAHLRGRHHLLALLVHVLASALPVRPLLALRSEVATLLEMAADDRACRETSRAALLSALLRLSTPHQATPGLAADGGTTLARALRLAGPVAVLPWATRLASASGALAFVTIPWLIGGVPVLLALTGHCDG